MEYGGIAELSRQLAIRGAESPRRIMTRWSWHDDLFGAIPEGCICGQADCTIPFGRCHCGCGGVTGLAKQSETARGLIGGMPVRYCNSGHCKIKPRVDLSGASPFKIDGVYCRLIPLTLAQYAIVWASDYERISLNGPWHAWRDKRAGGYYAKRRSVDANGKTILIKMHREILGMAVDDPDKGDHENGCSLDNRWSNLRPCTQRQNLWNAKIRSDNQSGFKGVGANGNGWMASITTDGVKEYLGTRKTREEAHALYCEAALRRHGKFARTA